MYILIGKLKHPNPHVKSKVYVPMVKDAGKRSRPLRLSFRRKRDAEGYGKRVIDRYNSVFQLN